MKIASKPVLFISGAAVAAASVIAVAAFIDADEPTASEPLVIRVTDDKAPTEKEQSNLATIAELKKLTRMLRGEAGETGETEAVKTGESK